MQVFEGVRVVELAEGVAVPYAGKLFGDFGADVIKVELPEGDVSRGWGPFIEGIAGSERSAPFSFFNRNKRGVSLDLATTWGRKAALALAMSAELVLTDRSFRQLDELGLGIRCPR